MVNSEDLRRFSLFSSLSSNDVVPLLPHLVERRYRRGQLLFVEGEIGSSVFFVLSGQVKLSRSTPASEKQIIDWCGPYDCFAEVLLLEAGSYPATAEAIKDSTLLVLNNEVMPQILEANPALSVALIRTLSRRLRLSQEFIRILTNRSTAGILAALFLRLARPAETPGKPIFVDASLTHRDLASMIGTSRECVNRAINSWKRSGILKLADDRLEILKPHELAEWP
ncbi:MULTISPECIES: Crp/Fnr family transcriptional regulator [Desulfosporosinus]|uniref:CRP/FNR family transcriptional regulator, anaerobic regulatory protein n=2 Tax=Desulfosporosinus TaxID=79206 RepID=A0A1M5WTF0_9FIRM|nr:MULTISPECIES: Crp/Fnr family transcriptional regulator [Desulfosporosinus]MCO1600467.1 Crp/Fnr family transcriptional regulator [Desulfosporosinus nitroreducens]MDO0821554.1 Crp/Fnr family transcriptional regulator [Desulfosporosinus nitroreducens]SHH90313.1 CRP/FNR family transcriptional regulator, anaerobic regulatory protein [Desulfosporosinus lacus DSM 15449]